MEFLTTTEVAERLRISMRTVQRWAADGIIPKPLRITGTKTARWRWEDIEKALNEKAPAANYVRRK